MLDDSDIDLLTENDGESDLETLGEILRLTLGETLADNEIEGLWLTLLDSLKLNEGLIEREALNPADGDALPEGDMLGETLELGLTLWLTEADTLNDGEILGDILTETEGLTLGETLELTL